MEKIECLKDGCEAPVNRIERYQTTVRWTKEEDGSWSCSAFDEGTHFHLFCTNEHETRAWPNPDPHADGALPKAALRVVFPGTFGGES